MMLDTMAIKHVMRIARLPHMKQYFTCEFLESMPLLWAALALDDAGLDPYKFLDGKFHEKLDKLMADIKRCES
jgi:hypothetical protein